jgi:hypothetical protein
MNYRYFPLTIACMMILLDASYEDLYKNSKAMAAVTSVKMVSFLISWSRGARVKLSSYQGGFRGSATKIDFFNFFRYFLRGPSSQEQHSNGSSN